MTVTGAHRCRTPFSPSANWLASAARDQTGRDSMPSCAYVPGSEKILFSRLRKSSSEGLRFQPTGGSAGTGWDGGRRPNQLPEAEEVEVTKDIATHHARMELDHVDADDLVLAPVRKPLLLLFARTWVGERNERRVWIGLVAEATKGDKRSGRSALYWKPLAGLTCTGTARVAC